MKRLLIVAFATCASACASATERAGVLFYYKPAALPESRIRKDLAYREGDGSDPRKHRLDLFLPPQEGSGFPVLVFVHGGYWSSGDRALVVGGKDIYGNIGRFYASRGIVTAVISYRLQPAVEHPAQLEDVAAAVAWVRARVAEHGGDPSKLFLAGHSAGGQLVTRLAVDRELQAAAALPEDFACGVIAVDGAGYDPEDEKTYELGADREKYRAYLGDGTEDWAKNASTVRRIRPTPPPFLILLASREEPKLVRQSQILEQKLRAAGGRVRGAVVPRQIHSSMALALSNPKSRAAVETLRFIAESSCAAAGGVD